MSYNTRRQGGGGGGGRGTSQVMYHQQQNPGARSAGSIRSSGPPQNTQGYPSGYNSQPSGGYSSGGNQGYSSQQYQAQQSPMAQQVVPPPPPPPMSVQQSPAPKPLHGILKTESSSPSAAMQSPVKTPSSPSGVGDAGEKVSDEATDGDARPRPPWMKKKQFGFKVNKTVKRRRQNARLRKLLQPKNAIMVLNELVTGVKFTVQEHMNALSQLTFQVSTEVEGKVYAGQALSKTVAKQIAAENALKALILEKISKSPMKMESSLAEKGDENSAGGGVSDGEESVNTDKNMDVQEDDVPWKSLTSFAIYKLFLEWQNEGTPVPCVGMPKPSGSTVQHSEDLVPRPMKKVPDNPTERHPVMLLNQVRPGVEFIELSRTGNPPDITFTLQTTVDGKCYTGSGKNKKEAKKEAAKAALAGAFDIHYS